MWKIDKSKYNLSLLYFKKHGYKIRTFKDSEDKLQKIEGILQWYEDNKNYNFHDLEYINLEPKEKLYSKICKTIENILGVLFIIAIAVGFLLLVCATTIIVKFSFEPLFYITYYVGVVLLTYFVCSLIIMPAYIRHLKLRNRFPLFYKYKGFKFYSFKDFFDLIGIDDHKFDDYNYNTCDIILYEIYYETIINCINYNIDNHGNIMFKFISSLPKEENSQYKYIETLICKLKDERKCFDLVQQLVNIQDLKLLFPETDGTNKDILFLQKISFPGLEYPKFYYTNKTLCILQTVRAGIILLLLFSYPAYLRWEYVEDQLIEQDYEQALEKYHNELNLIRAQKYVPLIVTVKNKLVENYHVGHNWSYYNYIDNNLLSSNNKITYHIGDTITLYNKIIEHDSWSDVGISKESMVFSFEDLINKDKTEITMNTMVVENRGRYSGNYARWITNYKLSFDMKNVHPSEMYFKEIETIRILKNYFNFDL